MEALLLQKIEELTLYTIQQEKKIIKQENIITNLNKINQLIEIRLRAIEYMLNIKPINK